MNQETCNGLQAAECFIRRGQCGPGWPQSLIWTDILSDGAIWLAYMLISGALVWFLVTRRESIRFLRIWGLFALFIFLCGMTHASDVMVFFWPNYWLDAAIRVACAGVSLATVGFLVQALPRIKKLPTMADFDRMMKDWSSGKWEKPPREPPQ